jgi:multidrug efflux pump
MVTTTAPPPARFGISPQLIDNTLYDAFGQRQVSTMYTSLNQYHVVMEVAPQYWQNPSSCGQHLRDSPGGQQVPLSAFAQFAPTTAPLSVNHQGLFPGGDHLVQPAARRGAGRRGDAIDKARRARSGCRPPFRPCFAGTAQAYQDSLGNEPILIAAALAAVYLVLGILYESYIHPITILSTLPSAGVGALLALMLTTPT